MRRFSQTDQLRKIFIKISKKDKTMYEAVLGKMQEVLTCADVNHYKNLKRPLQHLKRVHIGSFVLLFKYIQSDDSVDFVLFKHHDEAYA